jgi:hypothetical protein
MNVYFTRHNANVYFVSTGRSKAEWAVQQGMNTLAIVRSPRAMGGWYVTWDQVDLLRNGPVNNSKRGDSWFRTLREAKQCAREIA